MYRSWERYPPKTGGVNQDELTPGRIHRCVYRAGYNDPAGVAPTVRRCPTDGHSDITPFFLKGRNTAADEATSVPCRTPDRNERASASSRHIAEVRWRRAVVRGPIVSGHGGRLRYALASGPPAVQSVSPVRTFTIPTLPGPDRSSRPFSASGSDRHRRSNSTPLANRPSLSARVGTSSFRDGASIRRFRTWNRSSCRSRDPIPSSVAHRTPDHSLTSRSNPLSPIGENGAEPEHE